MILHELAHISRKDVVTNALARLICALLWFAPMAWLAYRSLLAEAEKSCDDQALDGGIDGADYAAALLALVQASNGRNVVRGAYAMAGRRSLLEARLRRILCPARPAEGRRPIAGRLVLVCMCCLLPLLAITCSARTGQEQARTAAQTQASETTTTIFGGGGFVPGPESPYVDKEREIERKVFKDLMENTPTHWPLEKGDRGKVTVKFAWITDSALGVGFLHTGIDIECSGRTAVLASAAGRVTVAGLGPDPDPYTGNGENTGQAVQVTLQHKYGFLSTYVHLAKDLPVKAGDAVEQGQVIGYVDETSYREKPFLHFEVRLGTEYIDPMTFLSITSGAN